MGVNRVVSVLASSQNKKRVGWFCCNVLVVMSAFFCFAGFANATAIMDIVWDEYNLNASAIWGPNTEYPPTGHVIGSANSVTKTGSLIADGPVSVYVASNNALVYAEAEVDFFGADFFGVETEASLNDDIPGSSATETGYVTSVWSVLFDILGDDATLEVEGWMLDYYPYYTNRVYLSDLTNMTSNLYTRYTSGIGLLAGHRYTLTQISGQHNHGMEDLNPTQTIFHNVRVHVPEPSTLLITGAGLFGFMLICGRKRDR